MAARHWTIEQRARQSELIRTWAPWTASSGPKTPAGKAVSRRNAFNGAIREVMRELTRSNRALIGFINGTGPAPSYDPTTIDGLLKDLERAVNADVTKRKEKAVVTATASALRTAAHAMT